jgi:hypothetical protein
VTVDPDDRTIDDRPGHDEAADDEPSDDPATSDRPGPGGDGGERGMRLRWESPSAGLLVALLIVVPMVVASMWFVLGRNQERSIEETVSAFFAARQDGDCERMVGVLSDASWSEGGLDHAQFLDRCSHVIGDYQPELDRVEVVAETSNRAVVEIALLPDDDDPLIPPDGLVVHLPFEDGGGRRVYEQGILVREDGAWKVEADQRVLRVGRSIEETVRGYIDAYNTGDCDHLIDYIGEATWSEDGRLSRDQYLGQCADQAAARAATVSPDDSLATARELRVPREIDVSLDEGNPLAATATWEAYPPEAATLVNEDLEWKLDGALQAAEYAEHQTLLLDEPLPGYQHDIASFVLQGADPTVDFGLYEGSDAVERRRHAGFARGAIQRFSDGDNFVLLLLYEFDTTAGASGYADHLAARVGRRAASRSPAPTPVVADQHGAVTDCDDDSCTRAIEAVAIGVHDRLVAAVQVTDDRDGAPTAEDLISRADGVLRAQLDQLP